MLHTEWRVPLSPTWTQADLSLDAFIGPTEILKALLPFSTRALLREGERGLRD